MKLSFCERRERFSVVVAVVIAIVVVVDEFEYVGVFIIVSGVKIVVVVLSSSLM